MHNATLQRIGRNHSVEDFLCAMERAKDMKCFSINCDLIAALPGESPEEFLSSVKQILALHPDQLTLHALCQKRSATQSSLETEAEGFRFAVEEAHKLCMNQELTPYYLYRQKMAAADLENVGFARKGEWGVYNLAMMEDLCHIFSCGAGGIGKILPSKENGSIRRFASFKYPFEYLSGGEEAIRQRLEKIRLALDQS
jgi:oxygen-independent coproporphyrinogen-3 oxidase